MLSCLQNPNAVQLYIVPNLLRDGVIASFVRDLAQAVATVRRQSRKIFDALTENISQEQQHQARTPA